jgi:hypothetical protein
LSRLSFATIEEASPGRAEAGFASGVEQQPGPRAARFNWGFALTLALCTGFWALVAAALGLS